MSTDSPARVAGAPANSTNSTEPTSPAPITEPILTAPPIPTPPAAIPATTTTDTNPTAHHQTPGLFSRGLLYVAVWSLQLIAGTVVFPVLAYVLGPAPLGMLASALALFQVLNVVAMIGLDQAIMLQRVEDDSNRDARGIITVAIAAAVLTSVFFVGTMPWWGAALGFGDHRQLLVAVIVWIIPTAAVQVMLALLMVEDRFRAFATISGIAAIGSQLTGVILLVTISSTPEMYVWGCVGSQLVAMLIAIGCTKPNLMGFRHWGMSWRAIRFGVPLALSGVAYFVLNAGDRLVIQRLLDATEVGRYQIAYVVGSAAILLLTFVSAAWTPRFAEVRERTALWLLATQARDELYRMLLPVILGVTLSTPVVLRVIAPASFRPMSLLVVVFLIVLSVLPFANSVVTGRLLVVQRRTKTVGLITGIAALANIGLNFALIPFFGIAGAAAATLAAFWLLALFQLKSLPRLPVWSPPPRGLIAAAAAVVVASAASCFLPQSTNFNVARFVLAVGCVGWLLRQLNRARKITGSLPVPLNTLTHTREDL